MTGRMIHRAAIPSSVRAAAIWGSAGLQAAGVPEASLEAQLLLAHALDTHRSWVLSHGEEQLSARAQAEYAALIARRCRREPYAYLVGARHWLDITLRVDRNVLIPRPETERLAQLAVTAATAQTQQVVVDVGTGSGALAIALARGCPTAVVYATDTSAGALRTASENIARLASGRVRLRHGELLAGIEEPIDVVVANLPYIATDELQALEPELAYEPRTALDGGADGLGPIRALLGEALPRLSRGSVILLECGHEQAGMIAHWAQGVRPGVIAHTHADLAGVQRFVDLRAPSTG